MVAFTGGCFHSRECTNFETDCGNCFYLKHPKQHDLSNSILTRKRKVYTPLNLHIVTCSNWLGERARRSSLFKNVPVHVIPNPIDVERFKPIDKKVAREKSKIALDSFVILFAAASISDDRKGISYLIESINKLLVLKPELKNVIELVVLGNVKNNEQFPFPCKTNFAGYVSDEMAIINYFSASTIFITPSLDENLPNTIMESLSCGTPVVAFKTGGIPDLIDHKINGYLADYKSSDDLVNGILWAYENRFNEQINKNARNKALNNYTYEIVAKKYTEVYESIISSHAKN
jgi:glycosyltransferase involved in cell wall biosynthesis